MIAFAIKSLIHSTVIEHRDLLFLILSPVFECTSSSEALLWMGTFSSSSLYKLFEKDRTSHFSNFLVSLMIFSSYSLRRTSFSSFFFVSFSTVALMVAISFFQLFVPIIMTGMTIVLEDPTSIIDQKACFRQNEEKSLLS